MQKLHRPCVFPATDYSIFRRWQAQARGLAAQDGVADPFRVRPSRLTCEYQGDARVPVGSRAAGVEVGRRAASSPRPDPVLSLPHAIQLPKNGSGASSVYHGDDSSGKGPATPVWSSWCGQSPAAEVNGSGPASRRPWFFQEVQSGANPAEPESGGSLRQLPSSLVTNGYACGLGNPVDQPAKGAYGCGVYKHLMFVVKSNIGRRGFGLSATHHGT